MNGRSITSTFAAALVFFSAPIAWSHEPPPDGCGAFSEDLAGELKVMRATAVSATAITEASRSLPQLQLDTHYAINLAAQDHLHFAAKPGGAAKSASARGGAFHFQVPASGRYRVSITSRHWIDVVDADTAIESANHFGPGCDVVHKVVEFDLPSGRPLTLQISGQDDAIIGLAITAAPKPVSP